jgi:hypothetical protein
MAKNQKNSKKTAVILIVVFICLIITATACVLALTPFGKRLLGIGKNGVPIEKPTIESYEDNPLSTKESQKVTLIAPDEMPSVSVPKPTKADIDNDKNYTFFIDKNTFDYTEADDVTTLKAKDNSNVIVTVTPYKNLSYSGLCYQTAKIHEKDSDQPKLNIETLYASYHSDMNGTTTTVYCIDDGNGGSIKLKLERPSNADEYDKHFELLVSMFKVK